MQIEVQYASEIITAVGLILGAILLTRFTMKRVKNLPPEDRHLGRPLWVATISIFLLGAASALNFGFRSGFATLEMPLLLTATLGSGLLLFAAIMILGSKKLLAIPLGLIVGVATYISIGNIIGGLPGGLTSENLSAVIGLILFLIPFFLFTYLTYTTKRITSFALAVVSITNAKRVPVLVPAKCKNGHNVILFVDKKFTIRDVETAGAVVDGDEQGSVDKAQSWMDSF